MDTTPWAMFDCLAGTKGKGCAAPQQLPQNMAGSAELEKISHPRT
jgi:hypothetical protein